jgi:hypothetical protein
MSSCTSGCPNPGTHESWGACLQAKALRIGWANSAAGIDLTKQKKWDMRIREYRDARRQGIKPASTRLKDVREAVKVSNETGNAFKGY